MSIKKDNNSQPDAQPVPFWVAVVATPGFDHPNLDDRLDRRLWPLLANRVKTAPRIALVCGANSATSRAASAVCNRRGWTHAGLGSCTDPRGDGLRTAVSQLANSNAAVLVFAGERPPADLTWLAEVAARLRVPVRWLRVD